jgi:hypothetical protein
MIAHIFATMSTGLRRIWHALPRERDAAPERPVGANRERLALTTPAKIAWTGTTMHAGNVAAGLAQSKI